MSFVSRRPLLAILAALGAVMIALLVAGPASAHGFSSVVYVDVRSGDSGHVRSTLEVEYDLLVVSAADAGRDDSLFQDGTDAFDNGDSRDRASVLDAHSAVVLDYLEPRFRVASAGERCEQAKVGKTSMTERQGVPYAVMTLDATCPKPSDAHVVTSRMFADSEGYVKGTKTVLKYEIDGRSGSAALDSEQTSFSTEQSTAERFWEFFHLGAEHLLTGIDHILFLLALIAGSRRLREVVLAATSFTLAHSVTFILAATGLVTVSPRVVEPIIALSIAVVAAWYLWRLWRRGEAVNDFDDTGGRLGLDRAGWTRLAVVFVFGLVHGLGFASALGINEAWSWTLLWSLLVFNLGIEVVQLSFIAVLFPLLMLLRRKSRRLGRWASGALAVVVSAAGLIWFVQRVLDL